MNLYPLHKKLYNPYVWLTLLLGLVGYILVNYPNSAADTTLILDSTNTEIVWQNNEDKFKDQLAQQVRNIPKDLTTGVIKLQNNLAKKANHLASVLNNQPPEVYKLETPLLSNTQSYNFNLDIKPILNKKCLACHACYDAPCQLKMETANGLKRGASKVKVYNGWRLNAIAPTRLGVDSQTISGWRNLGFFPVLNGYRGEHNSFTPSIMQHMIDLGHNSPLPVNKAIPKQIELGLTRKNSCPAPDEFQKYKTNNPNGGMPLAITGLNDTEYNILSTWLKEGAKTTPMPLQLTDEDQNLIKRWELWFNRDDNRSKLVARYIYEHLFLAHLYFDTSNPTKTPTFFRLIRSSTAPGQLPVPVLSVRPNGALTAPFYYRLQPIAETIVHKTHIIYAFGKQRINEYEQLFFSNNWKADILPSYTEAEKANPFKTFKAIPAKIRYQFLLNNASFFIRNFIRGPVCRGQIATDVIRDQFWIMFENPDTDRYVNNEKYQNKVNSLLDVPGLNSKLSDFGSEWLNYKKKRNLYLDQRQQEYKNAFPLGAELSHIWAGLTHKEAAFQTVFRHHDSASVMQGLHGNIPITSWLLDFPLLERIFYELVVGFNVFGNVSHQAQTRLYFDWVRNEAETNLLRLLPAKARNTIYQHWYQNSGKIATVLNYHPLDVTTPSAIKLPTSKPYAELMHKLVAQQQQNTFQAATKGNSTGDCSNISCTQIEHIHTLLQPLEAHSAKTITGINWLPEISFLRINMPNGNYLAYSLLRNRIHTNVAYMLGESFRYQEELDTITIMPTLIGSYPNLIFQVDYSELNLFVRGISKVTTDQAFNKVIEQWGIRRMNPEFWDIFHSFKNYMEQHQPLEAGAYDLNRYGHY